MSYIAVTVATTCLDSLHANWVLSEDGNIFNVHFDEEKVVTMVSIQPEFPGRSQFSLAYSRNCYTFHDVMENGKQKVKYRKLFIHLKVILVFLSITYLSN